MSRKVQTSFVDSLVFIFNCVPQLKIVFNNVYLFTESPDFRSNLLLCLPPGQDAVKLALSILKVDGHPITEDSEDQPKSGTRSTSGFNAWISSPSIDFHRARPLKVKQSKRIGSRSSPKRI